MFKGLLGLLGSKKGWMCLLVLAAITGLSAFGKLEGMAAVAGFSLIGTVYCFTAARVDVASMKRD